MSGLSNLNQVNLVEDEEEAALIDSFFLPGGILDPDEEEAASSLPAGLANSFAAAAAAAAAPRRVPSNPWSNQNGSEEEEEVRDEPLMEEPSQGIEHRCGPQHPPAPGRIGTINASNNNTTTLPKPLIRPPPGYAEYDRRQSYGNNNNNNNNTTTNNIATENDRGRHSLDMNLMQNLQQNNNNNYPRPSPSSSRLGTIDGSQIIPGHNRTIQRPRTTAPEEDTGQSPPPPPPAAGWSTPGINIAALEKSLPSHAYKKKTNLEFRESPGALEKRLVDVSSLEPCPRDHHHHPHVGKRNAPIKTTTRQEDEKSGSRGSRDDHDDDEAEEGEGEEENSVRSNSSIPFELLSVAGIHKGDSMTSSLSFSTCAGSDGDEDQEEGDVLDIDGELKDELEKIANHHADKSEIVGGADLLEKLSPSSHYNDDTPGTGFQTKEHDNRCSSESQPVDDIRARMYNKCTSGLVWIMSAFRIPKNVIQDFKRRNLQRIRQSGTFKSMTSVANTILIWNSQLFQWALDIKEIFGIWISHLFASLRVVLVTTTKALILLTSFLFLVWKYSLIEAVEETNVTICYMVFYLMPRFCSLLMEFVNLPHWTPHVITSVAVFTLCNQIKPGPLQPKEAALIFQLTDPTGGDSLKESNGTSSQGEEVQDNENPRDERACRSILRILRYVLPTFFVADGFSSEFGTIIGVSGSSRLTTAFMMSLVRKNSISSPIGWVSWAVQVLLATYYSPSSILDQVILVVGLSSIRLIRYLEGKRSKEKSRHVKSN
jgi:hypothetical protein